MSARTIELNRATLTTSLGWTAFWLAYAVVLGVIFSPQPIALLTAGGDQLSASTPASGGKKAGSF